MSNIENVLLINPPLREESPPQVHPLGLGYIGQVLIDNGYMVQIFDIDGHRFSKEQVVEELAELKPDLIGIGGMVTIYKYVKWLVPEIRRIHPKVPIVGGGGLATSIPEILLNTVDFDYLVLGEGEDTIVELLDYLGRGRDLMNVRGIAYRKNGEIIRTPSRPLIADLNTIPWQNVELFPIRNYIRNCENFINIMATRGCPFPCTYCFNNFRDTKAGIRYRSADDVIDEMVTLQDRYKVSGFAFADELFCTNKKWTKEFCRSLLERRVKTQYICAGHVNVMDEELMELLGRSGCIRLQYGLESGSQKMLDIMDKHVKVEQAKKTFMLSRRYVPMVHGTMMIGGLGENEETIRETVGFCKDLKIAPNFFFTTPYPGTRLWREALERGLIKDEVALIEQLGDALDFRINLSDLPDEDLIRLKGEAERELRLHAMIKGGLVRKFFKALTQSGFRVALWLTWSWFTVQFIQKRNREKASRAYLSDLEHGRREDVLKVEC